MVSRQSRRFESQEVQMKHRIAMLAAALLIGGATIASTASARDSFSIAIGAPGFGLGYSNHGYGYAYVAPPAYYGYGAPAYSYYPGPAYYGPTVAYYRPWYHHRYYAYRHW
jgi:hypothetical protein